MVRICFVKWCKYRSRKRKELEINNKISFFKFPTDPELRKKWVHALNRLNGHKYTSNLPKTAALCEEHFEKNCMEKIGFLHTRLKPHAVPTIFSPTEHKRLESLSTHNCHRLTSLKEQPMESMDLPNIPNEIPEISANELELTPSLEEPSTSRKKVRYSDDISENVLENLSSKSLISSILMLRKTCPKNENLINLNYDRLTNLKEQYMDLPNTRNEMSEVSANDLELTSSLEEPSISRKKVRYPGDITENVLENLSPKSLKSTVLILKKTCQKKDKLIKQLRSQKNQMIKRNKIFEEILKSIVVIEVNK